MDGKVVLVTGATDGIGKKTATDLARLGATVLLHGRNPDKCEAVRKEIARRTGNDRLRRYVADFSSLSEVRRLAEELAAQEERLDVLINNAGIGSGKLSDKRRALSPDGYELRMAVNYLAPFLLTLLLLPILRSSASARIVNVASIGQSRIGLDNFMLERGYDPFDAYKRSKLALVAFTFELAERLMADRIAVNCLHPGSLLNTKMVRESIPIGFGSVQSGADCVVRLATAPELADETGKYYDKKRESSADPQAYDRDFRKRLWQLSERLTGLAES
ncbi:SDR family NAD(P)-dependent oxidoreductase [Cohnella zeiphila]|uniref:SDR family NAD(P)-dependent oxidoreductase n=1 Tax=Cohnella zeiphila TaxID=2761120 RepID=A0A7X0SSN5_9BACL|nr:SDR family NAD(P)-dependent oxidoreductase [Cohnella zeiphila]MBB6735266.1 SDR family NAD(P)-dependent oxidoreductase [Cohnella zeiphila]